jgi:hypothetical protein
MHAGVGISPEGKESAEERYASLSGASCMNDFDDHVIPYEEAVRRRRVIEEAQREKGTIREVKVSDALDHLLEEEKSPDEDGLSPEALRRIVEREFSDEGGRSDQGPEERPRPHLVSAPKDDEPLGQLCDFKTRRCEDPAESPEGQPRR